MNTETKEATPTVSYFDPVFLQLKTFFSKLKKKDILEMSQENYDTFIDLTAKFCQGPAPSPTTDNEPVSKKRKTPEPKEKKEASQEQIQEKLAKIIDAIEQLETEQTKIEFVMDRFHELESKENKPTDETDETLICLQKIVAMMDKEMKKFTKQKAQLEKMLTVPE